MSRIKLSANFYLDEFVRSDTAARHGIDMSIRGGSLLFHNLHRLAKVMQPLRDALGPTYINSGYRPAKLNRLIGGSAHSQHTFALAADVIVPGRSPFVVARWLQHSGIEFDQLILEFDQWVHISIPSAGHTGRRQCLTSYKKKNWLGSMKTRYITGIRPAGERS